MKASSLNGEDAIVDAAPSHFLGPKTFNNSMIPLLYSMIASAIPEESDAANLFRLTISASVVGSAKSSLDKASTTTDEPRPFFP